MKNDSAIAIEVRIERASIGPATILRDIRTRIRRGCWSAIVGPNGAGKSTLLRVIAGLVPCTGEIRLQGVPLPDWPAKARARTLGWLDQIHRGGEDLLVVDIVMLGRLPHLGWMSAPGPTDNAAVERGLRAMQAWSLRGRRLGELSGGERQRVLLARLLATDAQVVLMDEPLAHLDPPHQADWLAVMHQLVNHGKTVVSVLHELNIALQADEILIIRDGRLHHQGACSSTSTHRALEAAFMQRIDVCPVRDTWIALPRFDPATGAHHEN